MKAVLVVWRDIESSGSGWRTQTELDNFISKDSGRTVKQLGFVIEDDEDQLVIVDSFFADKKTFGVTTVIPKGCVISVTPVMQVSKLSVKELPPMDALSEQSL